MAGGYHFPPVPEDMVLRQLREAMAANGVIPLEGLDSFAPVRDGKVHRFAVEGDRRGEKSGAYKFHPDDPPAGWFQDHRQTDVISWRFDYSELKDRAPYQAAYAQSQEPQFKSAMKQKQAEREKAEEAARIKASDDARVRFEAASPAPPDHPYLRKKNAGLYGESLKERNGNLLIPIRDERGRFMSFQEVSPEGEKRFCGGCPITGGALHYRGGRQGRPRFGCRGIRHGGDSLRTYAHDNGLRLQLSQPAACV